MVSNFNLVLIKIIEEVIINIRIMRYQIATIQITL